MEEPKEELAKQDQPLWTTGLIKSSRVHSPNELTPPLKRFKSEDSKPCKLHCKKCALHFEKWETYNEHTKWHALQVDKLRVPLKPLTKKQLKKSTKSRKLKTKKVLYTVKSSDQGELIFSTVQDNLQSKSECKDSIVANAENLNCKEEKPSAKNQNDKLQKILQKADDIVKKSVSEIPCETEKVESLKKLVQNYKRNSISKSEKNKKDHSSAGLAGLQTQDIEQFCDELVTAFYNSDVSTSDESHEILLKNNNTNITGQLNNENEDLPQSSGSEILNSAVNKEHPSNSNKSDNVNNIKLSLSNIVNAIVVKSVTVPSALSARTVTSDSELKETKTGNLPTGNLSDNASKNEQSKYSGELSEKYPVTSVSNNSNITSDVELKQSFQCGINNKPESLKEIKNTDKPVITNQIPLEKSCLQSENKLDKSVNTVDINVTESSLVSQTSSSASKNITGKNIVNREPIFQKLNSSQIKNNTVIRNSVFESNSNVNKNGNAQSATIADGSGKSASIQLSEDDRMVRLKAALQQAVNFPQHKCDVCHHSFKTKQALSRHKLSHLENTNYSCILCGRYFRLHSTLSRHMDSHRRMLYCDKCRTVFPSSEKFEAHLILHQNDLNSSEVPSASTGHSNYSTSMMNKAGANHSEEIGKADSANNSSNLESNRQISTSPGGQMQDVRPSIIQSANKTPPNVTKAVNISSKNDDDDDVILIASQPPGSARRPGTLNNDNTGVMPVIQNVCSAGIILTGEAANAQPKPQQNQQRPTLQQIQTQRQHYQHLQYQRQQQLQQQQQLQKQQEFHQQLQQQQLHQQQLQQQQHYQQQCQQQQQYQHQQHQQRQQQYQQQQQQYQQQLQYRQQQINSYQHQRQVGMQQLQHQQQQINNSNSQLMTLLSNPAVNQGNQSTEVSSQGPQNRNITVTSLEVPSGSHSGNVHRPGPVPTPLLRNKELTIMPLNPLENVNRTQNALTITPVTSQINPSISETNSPSHTSTSISITPVTTAREVSIIPMGPSVKSVIASNSAILHQSGNNSLNATNHRVQQVNPRMPAPPLPPLIPIPQTTRSVSITQISQQKDNPNCSNSIPQGNYANRIPVTLSNSANNARTGSNTNVSPLANRLHHIPVTYAQNRQNSHALMNSNNINNVSQKNSFSSNNSYMQNPSGMHLVSQSSSQMNNQKLNSRGDPESLYAGRYVPRSVDNLERPRQSLQQMSHIPQQMPNGIPRYPQDSNNQIRLSNYPTISTMSPPNVSISMNVPRPNLSQQVHPSQMDRYGRSLPPTLSSLNHFVQSHRPDGGSSHSGQGLISSCSQQQMAAYISNHKPYPIPPSLPPPPPYRMPFPPTSAASRMDNAHTNVSSPVVTRSNLLPYVEPITTNETSLGSLSQDVESLTCGICSSVFPDAAQLSSHLVTHTRDPSKDGEAHSPDVIFCSMEGTFDFTSINVKQEKDDKTDSPNEDVSNALTETMNDDISEVATTKKSFESVAEGTSKVVQTDNSEEAEISPPKENSSECSETKSTDNDAMECDSLVNTIDAKSNKILIKVIQSEMVEDLDEIDSDTDKLIGDTNVDSGIIMEKENNENLTPEKTQGSSHHSDIDQEVLISEETETILDETKMIGTNDIEIKEIENKDLEIKEIENKDLEGNEIVLNETLEYQDDEEELNADEMKAELNVSKSGSIYKESIIVSDKDENFDSNIPSPEEELELKMEEDSELWRETAAENKLPADCESGDTEKSSLPSSSNELLAYNSQWIEAARTAPKSLICPICDQTLPTILSFHRHLHQHKMLTRFFCRSCNLEFTTPEAYQEHKLLYHKPRKKKLILSPMVRKGQRKMSPFSVRCKLCQKKFNNFRLYQLHRSECERKTAELQNLAVPVIDLRSVASNADSLADIGISGFIPLYATSKINCAEEVNESPSSLGNSSSHLGIPLLDTNSIQTTNVQRLHELGIIRSLTLNAMHKLTDLPLVRSSTPVESLSSVPVPEEEHADTLTSQ